MRLICFGAAVLTALTFLPAGLSAQREALRTHKDFRKTTITRDFLTEGVSVADVNKDGRKDILAGYHWYEAPYWKHHVISESRVFLPRKEYSNSFLNLAIDVNHDGWIDQVIVDFPGKPGLWFENPGKKSGPWTRHAILDTVGIANESPAFVDVDGDGRLDIVCADVDKKQIVWLQAPLHAGDTWKRFPLSEPNVPGTRNFSHGLGYGDINGDGHPDVVVIEGWFEGTGEIRAGNWKFHPANLGEACSHMQIVDVNGDGRMDVISASAHKLGIWWHEQIRDADGKIDFKTHLISEGTAQTHSTIMADLDGDGKDEFITGKRFLAHHGRDPGDSAAAKLFYFSLTPGKAPYFIQHEIDNDSGAGLNIIAEDMNGDATIDLVIANKNGIFLLENFLPQKRRIKPKKG